MELCERGNTSLMRRYNLTTKKTIDGCVRRILRSMCNPAPRGKRIVFNDFCLGKSYWRWAWAEKMCDPTGLSFKDILKILSDKYYATLSEKMHSGKSCISSDKVFGGLLLYLKSVKSNKMGGGKLRKIIDRLSYLSAWKAIEVQPAEMNKKEIADIVKFGIKNEPTRSHRN